MKKKIAVLFMAMSVVLGCTACGEDGSITCVEVEGIEYDLAEDIQDVIGQMVENDLVVADLQSGAIFDDDGKYDKTTRLMNVMSDDKDVVGAREYYEIPSQMAKNNVIHKQYIIGFRGDADFSTVHGITQDSDEDDLEELNGFVPVPGRLNRGADCYGAIYADGELIDLEEYEDDLDDFIEMIEEEGYAAARAEYFPEGEHIPSMAGIVNQKAIAVSEARGDVEETLEKMYHPEWEGELLIALAAWEMGEKLVDGDIELYTIIVYDTTDTRGAGMCAYYDIYYIDENWDMRKFQKEK